MFPDGIFTAIAWFFVIVGLLGGFLVFEVIPWLWRVLKPWLHTITG